MPEQLIFSTGSVVTSGSLVSTGSLEQLNIDGYSGSFTGSFDGDGTQITGTVTADSASYVAGGNVDGAVETANTASYVAGGNVDGAVENANTASYAAGSSIDGPVSQLDGEASGAFTGSVVGSLTGGVTGTLTGSLRGDMQLTGESDMSGTTFAHQLPAIAGHSADFTISLDDNQIQQHAISASLEFLIEDGQVGGFWAIHFINSGAFDVTWPANVLYHSGTAITTSLASGALDIYTIHRLSDGNYAASIFGQAIS